MYRIIRFLLLLTVLFGIFLSAMADWEEIPDSIENPEQFGSSSFSYVFDVDGDILVAGNTLQNHVYVYSFDRSTRTWVLDATLEGDKTGGIDDVFAQFGSAVDIDAAHNRIAVASDFEYTNGIKHSGAVYIFELENGNWTRKDKLVPADAALDDSFGSSIALQGDMIVIGADGDDVAGQVTISHGSVYVFEFDGVDWVETQKITPTDLDIGNYGRSMALDGDYLVVGTANWVGASNLPGTVYLYKHNGTSWQPLQSRMVGGASDNFGGDLIIDNGRLFISASNYATNTENGVGTVYYYELINDVWTQKQQLFSTGFLAGDFFGGALAVEGDRLIVGAVGVDTNGINRKGAVYVFEFNGASWQQVDAFKPTTGVDLDYFGNSVGLYNGLIFVGEANYDSDTFSNAGRLLLYYPWVKVPTIVNAETSGVFSIDVSWNAAEEATFYTVERSLNGIDGWQVAGANVQGLSFADSGLGCGVTYHYRVIAGNMFNDGPVSVSASATTFECAVTDLEAVANGETTVNLSWTSPPDADAFNLERSLVGVGVWSAVATNLTETTYTDTVQCDTNYAYRVRAVYEGVPTEPSNIATAQTDDCSLFVFPREMGTFETKISETQWQVLGSDGKDKIKCNKDKDGDGVVDKIFANSGQCAFRFKGAENERAQLFAVFKDVQSLGLGADDLLNVSTFVRTGLDEPRTRIRIIVDYADKTRSKFILPFSKTNGYELYSDSYLLLNDVVKIKFRLRFRATKGKVLVDDVLFTGTQVTPLRDALIPLPEIPAIFRD